MKYYIAGPMTGYPDFNVPAFNLAALRLRACGHEIVNPVEVVTDLTTSWEECMKRDIAELVACDAVATLPEWHKSRGARLEVFIAGTLGMAVTSVKELLEVKQ